MPMMLEETIKVHQCKKCLMFNIEYQKLKNPENLFFQDFFILITTCYFLLSRYFCHSQVVRKASSKEVSAFQPSSFSALSALA